MTGILFSIYIHLFNGPLSGTTQVSWYQKGKTNLDFENENKKNRLFGMAAMHAGFT